MSVDEKIADTPDSLPGDGQTSVSVSADDDGPRYTRRDLDRKMSGQASAFKKQQAALESRIAELERDRAAAQEAALAEQGKYKELYESAKSKASAWDAYLVDLESSNAERIESLSDDDKPIVPKGLGPRDMDKWLDAFDKRLASQSSDNQSQSSDSHQHKIAIDTGVARPQKNGTSDERIKDLQRRVALKMSGRDAK